jgi:hypothetical protein
MVDVTALGALLAPALPYLLRAGEHVAAEASDALGRQTWEHAKRLWDKLGGAFGARAAAQEAAEDAAAAPDDAETRVVLVHQLRKLLDADPGLAREVEGLLADARQAGVIASGERSVAIGRDATDTVIVTGDDVRVDRD